MVGFASITWRELGANIANGGQGNIVSEKEFEPPRSVSKKTCRKRDIYSFRK